MPRRCHRLRLAILTRPRTGLLTRRLCHLADRIRLNEIFRARQPCQKSRRRLLSRATTAISFLAEMPAKMSLIESIVALRANLLSGQLRVSNPQKPLEDRDV